jgi:hypothetical protein
VPGFGAGPFGLYSFGEFEWGETVLYDYYPELDRSQDQQLVLAGQDFGGIGPLQAFSEGLIPSFNALRHRMRNFLNLRDAYKARTQYDTLTLLTLGSPVLPPQTIDQQGIDGKINSKLLFVSNAARFQSINVGYQLKISGSSIPGNNRTVTISAVIGLTTVRITPFLSFDNGPLTWELVQPEAASTTQTTFEITYGDPSEVNPNWLLTDGRGQFTVLARTMLSSTTEQQGQDGVLVTGGAPGVFEAPSGTFLPQDYGKFITIADSVYPQNNGRYQIAQVIPGSPTQLLLSRGQISNISTVSNNGTVTTIVTTTPHGLVSGQHIQVSGVTNTFFNGPFSDLIVLSPTEFQFPQTFSNYQLSTGGLVLVTEDEPNPILSLVGTGSTLTVTTQFSTGLLLGDTVTIQGALNPAFDGVYIVSALDSLTQFEVVSSVVASSSGGVAIRCLSTTNPLVTVVGSGTALTITTQFDNGLSVGSIVLVQGVGNPAFDGLYTVSVINTPTQFEVPSAVIGSSSGGVISTMNGIIDALNDGVNTTITMQRPNNTQVGQNIVISGTSISAFDGYYPIAAVISDTMFSVVQPQASTTVSTGGQVFRDQGLVQGEFLPDSGPLTWALLPRATLTVNNTGPAVIGWVERYGSDLQILLSQNSIGPVLFSGSPLTTGVLTPSGTPSGAYSIVLQITTGGAPGTAQLVYSLDNGRTYSVVPITIPAIGTISIPEASVLVSSSAGTYHQGDTFTFETTGSTQSIIYSPTASFDLGSFTSVVHTGTGTTVLTPSGVPLVTLLGNGSPGSYGVLVTITTAGAPGTGAFSYSVTGDTPVTLTIPSDGLFQLPGTGIIIGFSGTYVLGDTYGFNSTASGDVGKLLTIRGTVIEDGTYPIYTVLDSQHAVLFQDLTVFAPTVPPTTYYWEIRTPTSIGDDTQIQVNAPSLLAFLAEDFGIQIDAQEPENFQQAYVGNVTRWLDYKGLPQSYSTLGAMTGYDVNVDQLWRIPQDYGQNPDGTLIPPPLIGTSNFFIVGDGPPGAYATVPLINGAQWIQTPDGVLGHYGTDGILFQGPDSQVQFASPSMLLSYRDIDSQILVSGAAVSGNNKLFTIESLVVASYPPGSPLAGQTIFPAEDEIVHIGTGDGTISLSGYTTTMYQFVIRIDAPISGSNTSSFAYSTNGGVNFSPDQTIVVGFPFSIGTTGVTVIFSGGFDINDTYSFSPLLAAEFRPADVVHYLGDPSYVVVPETNNGSLTWSLVRTYTNLQPLLALFDEFNPDLMTQILDSFFSDVVHSGSGTGTVTPGGIIFPGASPTGPIVVTIATSGGVGTGTFYYTINGGPASPTVTIPATPVSIGATGVLVTFSGTFTATDTYTFDAVYTDAFSLDKYSWESDFNTQINITILSTLPVNSTTWQVTVQGGMQNGANYPNSPDVVLEVGHWALTDTSGAYYYLETVPQVGIGTSYTFTILSGVSPVVGDGYLQLIPEVQTTCGYCGSYKILATCEKDVNFPPTALASEQAPARLINRLQQALPEHAELIPVFEPQAGILLVELVTLGESIAVV